MVIIFASQLDELAPRVVAGWPKSGAALLTVDDLSTMGWSINNSDFSKSTIVASSKQYSVAELSGVITLMPYIPEQELFKIEKPNRQYVAAEMTAFLYYVFTSLKCPFVNKPSAYNLTGPNWRYEEWLRACHIVSLPVKPYQRHMTAKTATIPHTTYDRPEIKVIMVLGDKVITNQCEVFDTKVLELARLAGVQFLEVTFVEENGEMFFLSANCAPNINNPQILSALYDHFKQ